GNDTLPVPQQRPRPPRSPLFPYTTLFRSQIAVGIRAAIQTGRLRPGDRLPASRVLARELGVARQVVVAAYEDLAASGHLTGRTGDRKSTRLNSSHLGISYAVFCLKKKS